MIAGEKGMTGEFELVGGRHSGVPIDAIVKVKFEKIVTGGHASPLDPYELELSFTNKPVGSRRVSEFWDGERIKGNQLMCC